MWKVATKLQRECQFCDDHQQINMEEAPPGAGRKWNVTNLDGSFHKHNKQGPVATGQTTTVVNKPTDPTPEYEAKITAGLRSEAIAQAHKDNMEEGKLLRETITSLKTEINTFNKTAGQATVAIGFLAKSIYQLAKVYGAQLPPPDENEDQDPNRDEQWSNHL